MTTPQLDTKRIRVATPCSERWEDMSGDERVRHCARCRLNVYNVEGMTLAELQDELRRKNGELCVRIYYRKDGTVLTRDCPVGLRKVRLRLAASLVTAAAFAGAVLFAAWRPLTAAYEGPGGFRTRVLRLQEQARHWPVLGSMVKAVEPPPPSPERRALGKFTENQAY